MVEVIDRDSSYKMMMLVMCGICYQDVCYLVYSIRRDADSANLFISKLVKGSLGYLISEDFSNGEKEVLDSVVNRLLNKEDISALEKDGFFLFNDIKLDDNLFFDINKCYVCTVLRSGVKDCLIYYNLINDSILNQPVVEVYDDKRKFNDGFISSIALSIFGVLVLVFAIVVIYGILFS